MIKMRNLHSEVKNLVYGMMLGDVVFVNGDLGDDTATGESYEYAKKSLAGAVQNVVSGHHDYILCVGAETGAAAVAITQADLHIIGVGNGGMMNAWNRGYQYTCPAADALQPSTAADGLELAGIKFFTAAGQLVVDDAGADGMFFHHNTFTTAADTTTDNTDVTLDIEGKYFVCADSIFLRQKLAIDTAGTGAIIERCLFEADDAGSKAVNAAGLQTIVRDCIFNLSSSSAAVAITYAAASDAGAIINCRFDATINDAISNAGANVLIIDCYSDTITSNTTSVTYTAIND